MKQYLLLPLLLPFAVLSSNAAEDQHPDWTYNDFLGWVYDPWFPWTHSQVGWGYSLGDDPASWDNEWTYADGYGWYWTHGFGPEGVPWVYSEILGELGYLNRSNFFAALAARPILESDHERFPHGIEGDRFEVENTSLRDDMLVIDVTYSGGCEDHTFFLVSDGTVIETLPPRAHLSLIHNAKNDTCESIVSEELVFDIESLLPLWRSQDAELIIEINPDQDWGGFEFSAKP